MQTCPRRLNEAGLWSKEEDVDSWIVVESNTPNFFSKRVCSFCGSLHPEDFMDALRFKTVSLGPTDKNYKVYVLESGSDKVEKFFFQHLPEEHRKEFVQLFNEKRIKIGYPGHFYQLPFFIQE